MIYFCKVLFSVVGLAAHEAWEPNLGEIIALFELAWIQGGRTTNQPYVRPALHWLKMKSPRPGSPERLLP